MADLISRLRTVRWHEATESWMPGPVDALQLEAAHEIERLRTIEVAATSLLEAVDKTADHTEWFRPLSGLYIALRGHQQYGSKE